MKNCAFIFLFLFTYSNSTHAVGEPMSGEEVELHEFHMSKCQIEFNLNEKALQISMHIFIDDLEDALRNQGSGKLFIGTEKETDNADDYLYAYLKNHFQLKVNDQAVEYNFIGKETSEDLQAIWCYMEITNVESVNNIVVENNVLMEIFDDQKNIIQIMMPNKKQGYFMLEKGNSSDKATF